MYLSTRSTVLALVLAILLIAVLVLRLVLDRQILGLGKYFFKFSLNIWLYHTHTQCTQIL